MSTVLRLAWRNVWRNPRRTALTVAATVFAVYLVVVFVAMADGSHTKMIEDSVRIQSGHVQLAADGYLENRTLEYFLELDPGLEATLAEAPDVEAWAPRVNSAALLSLGSSTQGAILIGVDPERERTVSTLADRVNRGEFLISRMQDKVVLDERFQSTELRRRTRRFAFERSGVKRFTQQAHCSQPTVRESH